MSGSIQIQIGGKDYHLRYEIKQQLDILKNGPKKLAPDKKDLKFTSPMEALNFLGEFEAQIWLFQKALEWSGSGAEKIDFDKAAELRQEYLEQGEADAGEKHEEFTQLLADALALNVAGASAKKLMEKGEAMKKKKETEDLAKIYAAREMAADMKAGSKPQSEPQ